MTSVVSVTTTTIELLMTDMVTVLFDYSYNFNMRWVSILDHFVYRCLSHDWDL